jgi:mannan endo-1,4-beta-mannosidase
MITVAHLLLVILQCSHRGYRQWHHISRPLIPHIWLLWAMRAGSVPIQDMAVAIRTIGIDWIANLEIDSIDYGTVHLYPTGWGETDAWGSTWIDQHATWAQKIGKPVVLEEFGTTNTGARYSDVNMWMNSAYNDGYGGIQYWQFVSTFPSGYSSPDDGNGISVSESSYSLIKAMAVSMDSKSGGGSGGSGSSTTTASTTAPVSSSTGSVAQHWGQCGGVSWTGPTACVAPYTCKVSNPYYSQCL